MQHYECTGCEAGRYSVGTASAACDACAAGRYSPSGTTGSSSPDDCEVCGAGKYKVYPEAEIPVHECISGTFVPLSEGGCRKAASLAGKNWHDNTDGGSTEGMGCWLRTFGGEETVSWEACADAASQQKSLYCDSKPNGATLTRLDCPPIGASCSNCARGKHLQDDGNDVNSHDAEIDCVNCAIGKFSVEGSR